MSRQKQKGTSFESAVVRYLKEGLGEEGIERRSLNGKNDRGDVAGVYFMGERVVLEVKNHVRLELGAWIDEATTEQGNDDAAYSFVVFKRKGKGEKNMGEQYVLCTLENLRNMLALGPDNVKGKDDGV